MNPYCFPRFSVTTILLALATLSHPSSAKDGKTEITRWQDVSEWGIEGQGWSPAELTARYDRLPTKAEKIVRKAVWSLSRHSAGLSFRFNTDATEIKIRHRVGSSKIAMAHMPATGVSGIDIYALDDGKWVQEATFVLTSNEYNDIAVNIIKLIQQKKEDPNWEIEVELKL